MIAHWCYWKNIICCRRWLYNVFPADTADAAADALPLCVLLSIADKEKRYFYFSTFLVALLLFLFLLLLLPVPLLLFRRCSMMTLSVCLTEESKLTKEKRIFKRRTSRGSSCSRSWKGWRRQEVEEEQNEERTRRESQRRTSEGTIPECCYDNNLWPVCVVECLHACVRACATAKENDLRYIALVVYRATTTSTKTALNDHSHSHTKNRLLPTIIYMAE